MIKGVPNLLTYTRMNQATTEMRARMRDASLEAVTGRHADIPAATGAKIGEANLIKKGLQDIDSRIGLYGLVSARVETMVTSLGNIRDAFDDIGARALTTVDSGDSTGMRTIATEAEVALESVFSMLNVSQGNRTLFSGDAAQTAPLGPAQDLLADVEAIMTSSGDPAVVNAALDFYFNDPAGGFQTTIYRGGANKASSLVLGNGTRVDYTVKADDQAIKDTIRGLAVLATNRSLPMTQPGADYRAVVTAGIDNLEVGRAGLLDMEAKLGVTLNAIEKGIDNDSHERTVLSAVYQTLVGRDQYEAATELKQLETQLETSYLLTSRLSALNLTNFIR